MRVTDFASGNSKSKYISSKWEEEQFYMSAIPAQKNEPNDIRIRKYRDTLVTGGFAIIAFGIWTVIKSIMEAFTILRPMLGNMSFEDLTQVQAEQLRELIDSNALFYTLLIFVLFFLIVDLAVRVYVGLSARAIGLQKKLRSGKERNGIVWLVFGIMLTAFGLYSLIVSLTQAEELLHTYSIMYFVVSLFVDVTSIFVTAELVVTGFRLRGLTRKQNSSEEVRDAA